MNLGQSFLEDLRGRRLLLSLPQDTREVIRHARYFHLFHDAGVELLLPSSPVLKQLQCLIQGKITLVDDPTGMQDEVLKYDAAKLRFFFGHCPEQIPYLVVPDSTARKVDPLVGNGKKCVALCVHDTTGILDKIASNFTLHQLLSLNFCIFSDRPVDLNLQRFNHASFFNFTIEDLGIEVVSALLEKMWLVLAQDTVSGHLAGALNKKVFFLAPSATDLCRIESFATSYPATTIVPAAEDSWAAAAREVSLMVHFRASDEFSPFSTDCRSSINLDVDRITPPVTVEHVEDIDTIFDVQLPCLNNVQIETTTICNLSCDYCPNSTTGREHALMDTAVYHKIIDSLVEYLPQYTGTISPHFYGEPLTDHRLEELVAYTRQRLPHAAIELYTNGELLDAQRFIALKAAGVDLFRISQHTEEPSATIQEALPFIKKHHPELFTIDYKVFHQTPFKMNRGGLVSSTPIPGELMQQAAGCSMAHRVMTFDYQGNALLCCNDYLSQHSFGNIRDKSVREIWEARHYRRTRNAVMLGYLPYRMCRTCMWISSE